MKYLKLYENRKDDMKMLEIVRDMYVDIGGAIESPPHYKMQTRAGDVQLYFSYSIENEMILHILFDDIKKAEELLDDKLVNGLTISSRDNMLFFEESLDILSKIAIPEIEKEMIKYNL